MDSEAQAPRPALDEQTLAFAQAVFQAAREGRHDEIAGWLDQGLPPNLRNGKGDTLLMLASYHGHERLVRLLMEGGADAEISNDRGQTPLAAAAYQGYQNLVELLLDLGADVNGSGANGRRALMIAAMFNRLAIIDLLLSRGAAIDARDADGLTAERAAEIMGADEAAAKLARLRSGPG